MVFQFGQYKVDVDPEKTRKFYETQESFFDGCGCDGCRNLEKALALIPQTVKEFFAKLGIDPEKLFDCFAAGQKTEKTVLYQGICFAYGAVLEGKSAWEKAGENRHIWNGETAYPLTEDFRVSFENSSVRDKDVSEPAVKVEFTAIVPWLLDKKFSPGN